MKFLFALLLTANVLCGAAIEFRSGKLLCAELSSRKPSIRNFDASIYKNLPAEAIYAAVTFKPDRDRRISIHDYGIDFYGTTYPCIAVRKNSEVFSGSWREENTLIITDDKSTCTMLFILDAKEFGADKKTSVSLTLKALFPPAELSQQKVDFKVIGSQSFTDPKKIPSSGLMTEKK